MNPRSGRGDHLVVDKHMPVHRTHSYSLQQLLLHTIQNLFFFFSAGETLDQVPRFLVPPSIMVFDRQCPFSPPLLINPASLSGFFPHRGDLCSFFLWVLSDCQNGTALSCHTFMLTTDITPNQCSNRPPLSDPHPLRKNSQIHIGTRCVSMILP